MDKSIKFIMNAIVGFTIDSGKQVGFLLVGSSSNSSVFNINILDLTTNTLVSNETTITLLRHAQIIDAVFDQSSVEMYLLLQYYG